MIAHLTGNLLDKNPDRAIIDVQGVGYRVLIPLSTYYPLPEKNASVSLYIHTYLREDAIRLFGFFTEEEKEIFETLIGINKVGPKLALAILSGIPVQALREAVGENDFTRLSTIPGVGKKTAERLVLELKDKWPSLPKSQDPVSSKLEHFDDALSALINLGYKKLDAETTLKKIDKNSASTLSLEELIKESLNRMS